MFEVYITTTRFNHRPSLELAIEYAKELILEQKAQWFQPPAVIVNTENSLCVAIVTDDANGVTVHKLTA